MLASLSLRVGLGERSMTTNRRSMNTVIARWLLGLVLAVGGANVWMVAVHIASHWLAKRVETHLVWDSRDVVFRESGEPVLQLNRNVGYSFFPGEYRTLDDEPVTLSEAEQRRAWDPMWRMALFPEVPRLWLNNARFGGPRRLVDVATPLPWSVRVWEHSIHRLNRPPEFWFLTWPDRPGGTTYLTNYDSTTNAVRGHLSLAGFTAEKPSDEQALPAWDRNQRDVGRLISDSPNYVLPQTRNTSFLLTEGREPDVGLLYLTPARDAIYVINQTRRTVELARTFRDEPLRGVSAMPQSRTEVRDPVHGFHQVMLSARLALRRSDRLEFVGPDFQTTSTVTLPEDLRDRSFDLSVLKSGGYVARYYTPRWMQDFPSNENQLLWFTDDGTVTQRRTVPGHEFDRSWATRWFLCREYEVVNPLALMPWHLSALWTNSEAGTVTGDDLRLIGTTDEPTTWSIRQRAITTLIRRFPWSTGICLLSGMPFAIACWRRLRRVGASWFERLAWPALVYLFGLVGWIAFIAHREWPRGRGSCRRSAKSPKQLGSRSTGRME